MISSARTPDAWSLAAELLKEQNRAKILAGAALVASGQSLAAASRLLGMPPNTLALYKHHHAAEWEELLRALPSTPIVKPPKKIPEPSERTRAAIRKASALKAAGFTDVEIAEQMHVSPHTVDAWRDLYAARWREEFDRAAETALVLVRSQAGTDAILRDPSRYIAMARTCERWAGSRGEELFPVGEAVTLSSFYRREYVPLRLQDAAAPTRAKYEGTIRLWFLFTGDPPLKEITVSLLARFRDCLGKMRGKQPASKISPNTVRDHLQNVNTLLTKAGPPGPRNRDAVGLLPTMPPWVRPPKKVDKLPRIVTAEVLSQVYTAAAGMDVPRLRCVKPPPWWRALLVVVFNTALRRRTLFEVRMEEVDWRGSRLMLPAARFKSGRPMMVHLNDTALRHLVAIRTNRELVFEWPHTMQHFNHMFHRLQAAAGIPDAQHFGLHDIRKTTATIIWGDDPAAAQYALGHASMSTTARHYVASAGIVARALDALPQPEAFAGVLGAAK